MEQAVLLLFENQSPLIVAVVVVDVVVDVVVFVVVVDDVVVFVVVVVVDVVVVADLVVVVVHLLDLSVSDAALAAVGVGAVAGDVALQVVDGASVGAGVAVFGCSRYLPTFLKWY